MRRLLLLGLVLGSLLVATVPAKAAVVIDTDGIPVSDGFTWGSGNLQGLTVHSLTGRFTVANCRIGSNNSNCTETGFTIRSLPVEFNANYNDICVGEDAFTNSLTATVVCSLNDGKTSSALAGSVTSGTVTASSCNSWTISWPKENSRVYYVDKQNRGLTTANASFLVWGSISLSLRQAQPIGGDTWTVSMNLTGEGRSNGTPLTGSSTFTAAPWTMAGEIGTGANCGGGETSGAATILSSSGAATVSN